MRAWWKTVLGLAGLAVLLSFLAAMVLGWQPFEVIAAVQRRGLPPVRLGLLNSQTGPLAISEKSILDAEILAIEEVNAEGGINGRRIVYSYPDCGSDARTFAAEARRLLGDEKAVALFGCWTSESRKAVVPVLEELNGLLFFPGNFEGIERSTRVIYAGGAANQSVLPAVRWAYDAPLNARKFFVVGVQEVWSRCSAEIAKDGIKAAGAELVGESFASPTSPDVEPIVEAIRRANPDVVLNFLYGESNNAFYSSLRRVGLPPDKLPVVAFGFGEDEARRFSQGDILNQYAAWNYFQSVERPENVEFVRKFRARFEGNRVIGDPMVAAYNSIKFWAQAAREVGADDPPALVSSLLRQSMNAPDGIITVDRDSQAFWRPFHLGQMKGSGQFEIIWSIEKPIRPVVYVGTRSADDWRGFLEKLKLDWGGHWSAGASVPAPAAASSR